MNHYEICFQAWCGEPGRFKHKLSNYCKEGYRTNSETDERQSNEKCPDWVSRCSELRPRKRRGGWEPKVSFEPKRGKLI